MSVHVSRTIGRFVSILLNQSLRSFICAEHSRAPLKISRRMLVRVLSYYQVIPSYIDFLLVFGVHKHTRDRRFSGFHSQIHLEYTPSLAVDHLGRSGRQFQLCYNLKFVGRWTELGQLSPLDDQWSFRQGAFHHQFDILKGTALWIITRADLDLKKRIEETTGKTGRSEDRQFQTPEQSWPFICYFVTGRLRIGGRTSSGSRT